MSRPGKIKFHGRRPSQTPRRTSSTSAPSSTDERLGRVPGRSVRRIALAASILTLPLLLSGCSGEWASMSPSLTAKKPEMENVAKVTTATPEATPGSTPSATSTSPANPFADGDLADGSLKHSQQVGDHSLVINYWTDGNGTADVHLSAELKGADSDHAVKVTRFAASVDSSDGSTVPLADDQGEFVLTPPFSYTSALALPDRPDPGAAADTEVSSTIDVRFDLLVETTPGSGAFYRQTVLDTVALNASSSSEVVSEGASE